MEKGIQQNLISKINNEINYTELIIEDEIVYTEDYQMPMIRENCIRGLLKVSGRGIDNKSQYLYDITDYESLEKKYENICLDKERLEEFLGQFLRVVGELKRHMLDVNMLVLNPKYIFIKEDAYYFCYYPHNYQLITAGFHELTQFFVKTIDYSNIESVVLACGLHKETIGDQYNIEALLEKKVEASSYWNDDGIGYRRIDNLLEPEEACKTQEIRETPLKRFWLNKKREKWGSWENLLRHEESSIMGENK